MAPAIVAERLDLRADVVADVAAKDDVGVRGVLVEVVAQVQHEVRLILGQAGVRGEEAVLVLRARGEAHGQWAQGIRRRRRAGAPGRRELALSPEPVDVLPARLQPGELDVHAVPQLRARALRPAPHDLPEPLVGGDLPLDIGAPLAHAPEAVLGERVASEPGPEHHPVRDRFTGRDAESERVAARPCPRRARRRAGEREDGGGGHAGAEDGAPGQGLPDAPPHGRSVR